MREIKEIIIHCADTPEGRDVRADEIRRWHIKRGFNDIGYHYVIDLDGTIEIGRPIEQAGAHAQGHNAHSIGVCYVGGSAKDFSPKDTRTEAQKQSLICLLKFLRLMFKDAKIIGHRDVSEKACPCFDAQKEYENL